MRSLSTFRRTLLGLAAGTLSVAAVVVACGDPVGSAFQQPPPPTPVVDAQTFPPTDFGEAGPGTEGDGAVPNGILDVSPASATVHVTIVNGAITAPAQAFVASYSGQVVSGATWLFDRGELGDVDGAGVFTASGTNVGEGTITARYGAREGTAKVKVIVDSVQNGAPADADAGAGAGGLGGVGGEPLGPGVLDSIVAKLKTESNPPANAAELGFLYPYDGTVWPRGLLPPLLMWQSTREASAVYVKLSQAGYTFEGTYSVDQQPAGSAARKRVRIDDTAWRTATAGNTGDDLKLEVKIYSKGDDKVYGPITRTWKVAPGVLRGTVYYNSYDSFVTTGGKGETGGVIKIRPRSPNPELAANMGGKCHGCHSVSADGSTLFAEDGRVDFTTTTDDYRNGASYDLKQSPPVRTPYNGVANANNNRKFVWAAPYPDGSFALASYGYAREAYSAGGASKLYARAGGAELASTNIGQVTSAVTPSFAPDGRKVAFNFWAGPGDGPVKAGAGRSLAIFDFNCGAAAGSVTCAAGTTPAFSGLREIYRDNARWPGWPSFLPDGAAVIFHNTVASADVGSGSDCRANIVNPPPNINNCQLTTWKPDTNATGATAEVWIARDTTIPTARRLDALNGIGAGQTSYLPTAANHLDDTKLNYMPTVNPVASGGYYWVVFTSRRLYGNVLTGDPHEWGGSQKKLWVAAIDINNPDAVADPSHPAFYLPGQELDAGNARGFWVVDPCKANGQSCETGDECCNGFCRKDQTSGALVCMDAPPGNKCAEEFEKCTIDADCCDTKFKCIAGKCSRPDPIIK